MTIRNQVLLSLATALLGAAFIAEGPLAADEPRAADRLCPVRGRKADPATALFLNGRTVAFCCRQCRKKYRAAHENRLSESERKGGWKLLFNGRDLEGFQKPTRDGKWSVKDGVLVGTGGRGVIGTRARFADFELRTDARIHDTGERRGNSGIFVRSTGLTAFRNRWPDGFEIQLDNGDPKFWTGAIWKTAAAKKVTTKDGKWFNMRIRVVGPRIQVWVNDELVTDHTATGEAARPRPGPISLQVHHPSDVVEFKNLKIRPLPAGES